MEQKPQNYNRSTAKRHVLETIPFKITKKSRKQALDNTDLSIAYDQLDTAMKNMLVAIANTPLEMPGLSLINNLKNKFVKLIIKFDKQKEA